MRTGCGGLEVGKVRSVQSYLVDMILRVTNRRASMGRRLDGDLPVVSAEPGEKVRALATVDREEADGSAVWWLGPREGGPPAATVLFLHGGGYINGFDPRHWDMLGTLVRQARVRVCAPDYPLAPGTTADRLVPWTLDRYAAVAADGPVVLMGDSAGGGLALTVAVAARDAGLPAPVRIVLLSPWLDVSMGGPDAEELDRGDVFLSQAGLQRAGLAYAGALDVRDPRVSPLFADLTGLPPTEVHAGSRDQLVSDARRLVQRATAEFPEWDLRYEEAPGMVHDWAIIGLLPEARRTLTGIASRIGAAS